MSATLCSTSSRTTRRSRGSTSRCVLPASLSPRARTVADMRPLLQNRSNVRRVVCVMAPGILAPDLGVAQPPVSTNLPFALRPSSEGLSCKVSVMQSLFSHACPTKAPGERNRMHSPYQSFTTCPLTGAEKERRERARKERASPSSATSRRASEIVLTRPLDARRWPSAAHLGPERLPPLARADGRAGVPDTVPSSLTSSHRPRRDLLVRRLEKGRRLDRGAVPAREGGAQARPRPRLRDGASPLALPPAAHTRSSS